MSEDESSGKPDGSLSDEEVTRRIEAAFPSYKCEVDGDKHFGRLVNLKFRIFDSAGNIVDGPHNIPPLCFEDEALLDRFIKEAQKRFRRKVGDKGNSLDP